MWCQRKDFEIDNPGFVDKPKLYKMRCPKCGKYLQVRVVECHDSGCWHILLPAHKIPKAKRKRKKYIDMADGHPRISIIDLFF